MSELRFSDIVFGNNNFVSRKLLAEALSHQRTSSSLKNDNEKEFEAFKIRGMRVVKLCKGLFSDSENRIFIGESLLKNAVKEHNIEKRD